MLGLIGYRITPPIDLSGVGAIASSHISWEATTPDGTDIIIESSIDGGNTWSLCQNGGSIPNVKGDVSGVKLLIRQKFLSSGDSTPTIHSLNVYVEPSSPRLTQGYRVSKPLELPSKGIVLDSNVQWEQEVPLGANLTVEVSGDRLSWFRCENRSSITDFLTTTKPQKIWFRVNMSSNGYNSPSLSDFKVSVMFRSYESGEVESKVFELNMTQPLGTLLECDSPEGTHVMRMARTGPDLGSLGSWVELDGRYTPFIPDRYYQEKIVMKSTNGTDTPVIRKLTIFPDGDFRDGKLVTI